MLRCTVPKDHNCKTLTAAKEEARYLLGQFFMQVQKRKTTASHCRPSHQTHFTVRSPLSPSLQTDFPLLRLGVKWKMFNRHSTREIVIIKQNTSHGSTLRSHRPCLRSLSWPVPSVAAKYWRGGVTAQHRVTMMVPSLLNGLEWSR